jgi:ParB family chromosome partitioning protein
MTTQETTMQIREVAPGDLNVAANVRRDVALTKDFIASIKTHGVKIPIIAQETTLGLEVLDGQRRTLAAIEAGLTTVPVIIQDTVADDGERIVSQIVVNDQRASLTRADTVEAVKQLAFDLKMPAASIAKKVGMPKASVEQVIRVAESPVAASAFEQPQISLEAAAKIAEADLNDEEAAEVLRYPHQLEHRLQQVLTERARAQKIADLTLAATEHGLTIVDQPSKGNYYANEKNKHLYLDWLVDKTTGKKLDPVEHESCPGHAAYIGRRGYNGEPELHLLCTDPSKYGHRDHDRQAPKQLTEAEKAERAENAAAAKVWPSIVQVRRDWLKTLLQRKTMPTGWEQLVLWVDLGEAGSGGAWEWGPLAAELLGTQESIYGASGVSKWLDQNPTKTATALVAIALAQIELSAGVSKSWKGWRARKVPEYCTLLASWGYPLSETEQALIDNANGAPTA